MSQRMGDIDINDIYTDLMRKFRDEGHEVYIMYPLERRVGLRTRLIKQDNMNILGVKTLNVSKANIVEKGIGQLLIEYQFKYALYKYYFGIKFDIILYSTPPITFTNVIKYVKKCNPFAISYLLLKDIFPQNAVDMGILSISGFKGLLYRLFRFKENELYKVSDYIGCMSPANIKYLLAHNKYINPKIVELAPNSCVVPKYNVIIKNEVIRLKYNLPIDKPIFIYGGNMGKPQGIPFLIECLNAVKNRIDCHFVIVGDGTEYPKLEKWMLREKSSSISVFRALPKRDYDVLVSVCDVGMIFLDYNFTIPNYPSRLLTYLINSKPIIAVTDPNCDIGVIAEENGYGFYCPSNSVELFVQTIDKILASNIQKMGRLGYQYYLNNYTIEHTYEAIMKHVI